MHINHFLKPVTDKGPGKSLNMCYINSNFFKRVLMGVGFARLCSEKKHIMLLAVLNFLRNYVKIMLLSENYALCHQIMLLKFYIDFKENKDHQ